VREFRRPPHTKVVTKIVTGNRSVPPFLRGTALVGDEAPGHPSISDNAGITRSPPYDQWTPKAAVLQGVPGPLTDGVLTLILSQPATPSGPRTHSSNMAVKILGALMKPEQILDLSRSFAG